MKPVLYIDTCRTREYSLRVFLYLFDKYWPNQDLKILGYGDCIPDYTLPPNCEFIVMDDIQRGGADAWCSYLNDYFSSIDDEVIIRGADDHLISDFVSVDILDNLISIINNDPSIGILNLTHGPSTRPHTIVKDYGEYNLIEFPQRTEDGNPFTYRISGNFSMWRREYLLKFLNKGWTSWDFELRGTVLSEGDGVRVLATSKKNVVYQVEGIRRLIAPDKFNMLGIKKEDIFHLIQNNYVVQADIIGEQEWL